MFAIQCQLRSAVHQMYEAEILRKYMTSFVIKSFLNVCSNISYYRITELNTIHQYV